MTIGQRIADLASNSFALALIIGSIFFGFFKAVLWVWIIPRVCIFFIHAYFICYLPHAMEHGGYQVKRVRQTGWLQRFISIEQNMHGVHHAWPWIPWHQYNNFISLNSDTTLKENIEMV
jgi:beta-carotene hydroxylase